jgi:DNA-binding Lrp family transcriptional regulator
MTTRPPDDFDRRLIIATQAGLPLVPRPYDVLAEQLGISPGEVRARLAAMLDNGRIRRIGAVPNHYALGYTANGMSVWDVPTTRIAELLGEAVGRLPGVTHCYERPPRLPDWPYNLFAMVHGHSSVEKSLSLKSGCSTNAEIRLAIDTSCSWSLSISGMSR